MKDISHLNTQTLSPASVWVPLGKLCPKAKHPEGYFGSDCDFKCNCTKKSFSNWLKQKKSSVLP